MNNKHQPYFVELYNLRLSGEIPPSTTERRKLSSVVYKHYDFRPTVVTMPSTILGDDKKQQAPGYFIGIDEKTSFGITPDDLQYVEHQPDFLFRSYGPGESPFYRSSRNWWEEDYRTFLDEYQHLRSLLNGYIEQEIKMSDLLWLDEVLANNINYGLMRYSQRPPQTMRDDPIPIQGGNPESKVDLRFWTVKSKPRPTKRLEPHALILFNAYSELISLLEQKLTLRRCQAPETQKTLVCPNIFMPLAVGKEQKYCSTKCANRARRHDYYLRTGK